MVKVKVNPMWHDLFQRVSAKGEGKNQELNYIHGAVKVEHVDNVQVNYICGAVEVKGEVK